MEINLFNEIVFPKEKERKTIKENYFDTQELFIDIKEFLANNNLTKNIIVKNNILESDFEIVNQDIREKIRRFNNDIFYLTIALFKMCNYYNVLINSIGDKALANEILYRCSARSVCVEIFMYEEKIKNLIRNLLGLDFKKTRKVEKLMQALQELGKKNADIKDFCIVATSYESDSAIRFVREIRNNEMHNDSQLDEYTDTIRLKNSTATCSPFHVIGNDKLYSEIKNALNEQVKLKNALQKIIDNYIRL